MIRQVAGLVVGLLAFTSGVTAQGVIIQSPITEEILPLDQLDLDLFIEELKAEQATTAELGARLRALDKISGEVVDFDLAPEQTKQLGYIQVTLNECRFPTGNPAGDASAHLIIRDVGSANVAFQGWMMASSPALNGLDHARYDVWVLRCITS